MTGIEWGTLGSTARLESFATHLIIPLLVVRLARLRVRAARGPRRRAPALRGARARGRTPTDRLGAARLGQAAHPRRPPRADLARRRRRHRSAEPRLRIALDELEQAVRDIDASLTELRTSLGGQRLEEAIARRAAELQAASGIAIAVQGKHARAADVRRGARLPRRVRSDDERRPARPADAHRREGRRPRRAARPGRQPTTASACRAASSRVVDRAAVDGGARPHARRRAASPVPLPGGGTRIELVGAARRRRAQHRKPVRRADAPQHGLDALEELVACEPGHPLQLGARRAQEQQSRDRDVLRLEQGEQPLALLARELGSGPRVAGPPRGASRTAPARWRAWPAARPPARAAPAPPARRRRRPS